MWQLGATFLLDLGTTTDLCKLLGDQTRVRLLALLAQEELTVAELTRVTQLAQSRVSTHLGKLREAGLVRDRRAGGSTYYALDRSMPDAIREVWETVRKHAAGAMLDADREQLVAVIRDRERGRSWADTVAGSMARHYSPGRTWEALGRGLVGFAELGRVLDIASGDGALAELLAPRAREVVCLDVSERVVARGAERLAHVDNVRFEIGDMHALPFEDASFDQVAMLCALPYSDDPGRAVSEARRVLVPGGRIVVTNLRTHAHAGIAERYGHVRLGMEPEDLGAVLTDAGLDVTFCALTSRERRQPHFEVVTAFARRP